MSRCQNQPDERRKEHESDAMCLLARLRGIPQSAPDEFWPSTAELQREGIFGLRPVNRLVDLRRGKYGHKYDIEKVNCGHGTFRWRLHEPNRPGHPKDKQQTVLPLSSSQDWYVRQTGKPRPSGKPQEPGCDLPLFAGMVRK